MVQSTNGCLDPFRLFSTTVGMGSVHWVGRRCRLERLLCTTPCIWWEKEMVVQSWTGWFRHARVQYSIPPSNLSQSLNGQLSTRSALPSHSLQAPVIDRKVDNHSSGYKKISAIVPLDTTDPTDLGTNVSVNHLLYLDVLRGSKTAVPVQNMVL